MTHGNRVLVPQCHIVDVLTPWGLWSQEGWVQKHPAEVNIDTLQPRVLSYRWSREDTRRRSNLRKKVTFKLNSRNVLISEVSWENISLVQIFLLEHASLLKVCIITWSIKNGNAQILHYTCWSPICRLLILLTPDQSEWSAHVPLHARERDLRWRLLVSTRVLKIVPRVSPYPSL